MKILFKGKLPEPPQPPGQRFALLCARCSTVVEIARSELLMQTDRGVFVCKFVNCPVCKHGIVDSPECRRHAKEKIQAVSLKNIEVPDPEDI